MKLFSNKSWLLLLFVFAFGLSCNKDIYEHEKFSGVVPPEFVQLKNKVDQIINNNRAIIPKEIDLHIMWNTAVQVNNHVEVEISNGKNILLNPIANFGSGMNKVGKILLKIDDIIEPEELTIFGIIPQNKSYFIDRKINLTDLGKPDFDGYFWASDLSFKPYAFFEYEKGILKTIFRAGIEIEPTENILLREFGEDCIYLALVETEWWGNQEVGQTIVAIYGVLWCPDKNILELTPEELCHLYPYLCDNGAGGGADVEDEDRCNCSGPQDLKVQVGHKFLNQINGYFDYNLVLSQLNCNNGNYGYSVEPEDHLFMCTRSEKYKYSYTLSKVENNCSFEVKHHVNVGGEVKLSIVGEWSGVMPISYTFNKDVNFNIY